MRQYLVPFLVGVAFIACCLVFHQIGSAGGYQRGYDEALNLPHKPDTVYKTKLVTIEKPVEVVKWKDREKPVYIPVVEVDTVHHHDTTFIALEREFRQYSGENYEAQVSGVQPNLDWIKINQQTAYITNTVVQKKRWSFSLAAGPGIFWDGKEVKPGAGLVIGGSYNF